MPYTPVIGVEVHAELLTESKMFCACKNQFGGTANTRCCPVCIGLPGSLPVPNKKAVELTIRTGLALNCQVHELARFYRKNYFYPDLAKNYQISQYDEPLTYAGYLHLRVNGDDVRIQIRRAHLEEDTGKNTHLPDGTSLVDYNRCGVPLMEIVTEPDFRSAEQVREYLHELRRLMRYLSVSTANMEEGAMRAEANVNLVDLHTDDRTPIVEIKNIGSISHCYNAIKYEIQRQRTLLEEGNLPKHRQTRRWDNDRQITSLMREKETADDYMYFPEPDLVPMAPDPQWVEQIRDNLPELPWVRERRFIDQYDLPEYDAEVLSESQEIADYFEAVAQNCKNPKKASNWVMGHIMATLNDRNMTIQEFAVDPVHIADLIAAVEDGVISNNVAEQVCDEVLETGDPPAQIIEQRGLQQISDQDELLKLVKEAMQANPDAVEDYKAGKEKASGAIIGYVMRETNGQANPKLAKQLFEDQVAD